MALARRADASEKMVGVLAGGSVLAGAAVGGSLVVADAYATGSTMEVAVGEGNLASSPIHVAYREAGGEWIHATGRELFKMQVRTANADRFVKGASFIRRLPILYPSAVTAMEGQKAWSCVTSMIQAFSRGWFGGC